MMISSTSAFLKKTVLLLLLLLLAPALSWAFNYPQPAYISSFYLCNKLIRQGNSIQPDKVLSILKADNPNEAAHVVINFVGNKGTHTPEVEILDMNGKLFSNIIKFSPVTIENDDTSFRVAPKISGRLPEGGIFLKVTDSLDSGSRTMIGMFGLKTVK